MKNIPRSKYSVSTNANSSHVLYKIKYNDELSLSLKPIIVQNSNKDRMKTEVMNYCSTCAPPWLRSVDSIASLFGSKVDNEDVDSAFVQTRSAAYNVFVRPPIESTYKSISVKSPMVAHCGCKRPGKCQSKMAVAVWQMFRASNDKTKIMSKWSFKLKKQLILKSARVADDSDVPGKHDNARTIIASLNWQFKLVTISSGPNHTCFSETSKAMRTNADA